MNKKIAIITGGSSGIGLEIAKHLTSVGYFPVAWDIQKPASESGGTDHIFCDVSSEAAVNQAFVETLEKHGSPQVLVNNSGLQFLSPIDEFPLEKWNHLIGVMLTGTFLCCKAVLPEMKKNGFGRIVNISSIHGKVASPFKAAYVSAKHGVLGLSKVIALEAAAHGITINSICPGFVDTPLMRKQVAAQAELNKISEEEVIGKIMLSPQSIKKFTSPRQIAELVEFLCSDSASTITGEAFNVSGGWGM